MQLLINAPVFAGGRCEKRLSAEDPLCVADFQQQAQQQPHQGGGSENQVIGLHTERVRHRSAHVEKEDAGQGVDGVYKKK